MRKSSFDSVKFPAHGAAAVRDSVEGVLSPRLGRGGWRAVMGVLLAAGLLTAPTESRAGDFGLVGDIVSLGADIVGLAVDAVIVVGGATFTFGKLAVENPELALQLAALAAPYAPVALKVPTTIASLQRNLAAFNQAVDNMQKTQDGARLIRQVVQEADTADRPAARLVSRKNSDIPGARLVARSTVKRIISD